MTKATGFIVDFATVKAACAKLRAVLDHGYLNDIPGLELPWLENISRWIWQQLKPELPMLSRVTLRRDPVRQGCIYSGD